jgi:hypothetical protein
VDSFWSLIHRFESPPWKRFVEETGTLEIVCSFARNKQSSITTYDSQRPIIYSRSFRKKPEGRETVKMSSSLMEKKKNLETFFVGQKYHLSQLSSRCSPETLEIVCSFARNKQSSITTYDSQRPIIYSRCFRKKPKDERRRYREVGETRDWIATIQLILVFFCLHLKKTTLICRRKLALCYGIGILFFLFYNFFSLDRVFWVGMGGVKKHRLGLLEWKLHVFTPARAAAHPRIAFEYTIRYHNELPMQVHRNNSMACTVCNRSLHDIPHRFAHNILPGLSCSRPHFVLGRVIFYMQDTWRVM